MNVALLTGRSGSKSITKKNVMPVLGRSLASYPMVSALRSPSIDRVYISTDCPDLRGLASEMGVEVIPRPTAISGDRAELVHAIEHAIDWIGEQIEFLVTMHCNCGTHRPGLIEDCLTKLRQHEAADSCVTGCIDKSIHPYRTRRVGADGQLRPWFDIPKQTSSNRQTMDGCLTLDGAVRAMRVASCFPPHGDQPFPYLGKSILYVENEGGRDVHSEEDVWLTESYLKQHGWTENDLPPDWRGL